MAEISSENAIVSQRTSLALLPQAAHGLCSDEHLAEISKKIVDWRFVSPHLGLTEADEFAILGENSHSVPAQKIAMLRKWKQNQGTKATYKRLCKVLRKCGLCDLEEKVTELMLAESSSSSDEEGETYIHVIHLVHVHVVACMMDLVQKSITCIVPAPTDDKGCD